MGHSCPHCTDEETEVQKGETTCPSQAAGEWRCWDLAPAWPYPKGGEYALDTAGTLVTAGGQRVTALEWHEEA